MRWTSRLAVGLRVRVEYNNIFIFHLHRPPRDYATCSQLPARLFSCTTTHKRAALGHQLAVGIGARPRVQLSYTNDRKRVC